MIYKISTINDVTKLIDVFPTEVIDECKRVATILDANYNNISMDGGFAAIVENEFDLEYARVHYVDYTSTPYEFADVIPNSGYVSVLFLPATEYAVNLIIPISILPVNIAVNRD